MNHILPLVALAAMASPAAADYAAFRPEPAASRAWAVTSKNCSDGAVMPALSSLPNGESRVGVLRSADFDCPAKLSFYLAGHSHQNANFVKLVDAASGEAIRSEPPPGQDAAQPVAWDLSASAGKRVRLELVDGDTGSGWAWMTFGRLAPEVIAMPSAGSGAVPGGWIETVQPAVETKAHGVPFLEASIWKPSKEGETLALGAGGIKARSLFVLGGVNSVDEAVPGWGGSDDAHTVFLGDSAGTLKIAYSNGTVDSIPLIFGYSIWFRDPYNRCPEPFKSNPKLRETLDRALCVAGGIQGGVTPYFIKVNLRDEPVSSLIFEDDAVKAGHAAVRGVTFGDVARPGLIDRNKFAVFTGDAVPADIAKWLESHPINSADGYPEARRKALDELVSFFYTRPSDINLKTIASVKPEFTDDNYPGPKVTFSGPPEAALLTNVYYENSNELLVRVDDEGMLHESNAKADYYSGFGNYTPELHAFYSNSYTRLRALTLLGNSGFREKAEKAIAFFDKWLMYFPKSYPTLQLGGKPVPGHTTVIANEPHVYFDTLRAAGWPTKYTTRDFGNPETDGHGLLMLTRWRAWVKSGRTADWVTQRWEAINEAAELIPWSLDNPELSFSEHGLLYAESEGGMLTESLYCNVPCYLGLLGYAEMAEAAGKPEKATRWRGQAERLFTAMQAYFPGKDAKWGEIWDGAKTGGWGAATALAPIVLGMDLFGYDAVNSLPADWAERTRRTYDKVIETARPKYCAPNGMGYNQCYFAEASLLLDRMSDADGFVSWMARFCFAPNLPHPYRTPEGAAIKQDGSMWRRWGDLGNLYQLGEVVYTTQVMIGIDDLDPGCVKLMPRLPARWTGLAVEKWPVRTSSNGKSALVPISMTVKRDRAGKTFTMDVASEAPVDSYKVRIGPFAADAKAVKVDLNDKPVESNLFEQGDSKWAWVGIAGEAKGYRIRARVSR